METATAPDEESLMAEPHDEPKGTPETVVPQQPTSWWQVWFGRGILLIALIATWALCFIVFRLLNRTTIYGKEFAGPRRRCLIVSNHQTLIDSFLVGWAIYYPSIMWHPDLAPAHLADAKNFTSHGTLRYIYNVLRVIPVARTAKGKRNDVAALKAVRQVLDNGRALHVFIEGTRSQTEQMLPPRREVGGHALVNGVTVLPVYFTGMHAVQPYCKNPADLPPTWWNRMFGKPGRHTEWLLNIRRGHQITVVIGAPMSPDELKAIAGQGPTRERHTRVAEEIHQRLTLLRKSLPPPSLRIR